MTGWRGTPHTSPSGHFPLPLSREAAAGLGGGEPVFSKGARIGGGDITYFFLGVQLAQGAHVCLAGASEPQRAADLCLHLGQLVVSHKLQPLLCAGQSDTPASDIPAALSQDLL